jgi:hypothetical protein
MRTERTANIMSHKQLADVDPRIAATGGYRRNPRDPKSNYEWPGMVSLPNWRLTRVHEHTAYYGCAKCGARFGSPQAVYAHLARAHPAAWSRPRLADLRPSEVSSRGNGRVGANSPSGMVSLHTGREEAGA